MNKKRMGWMVLGTGLALSVAVTPSLAQAAAAAVQDQFNALVARMKGEKPKLAAAHKKQLEERYDLADRPGKTTMSRGKPLQEGVRAKLASGVTWEALGEMTPAEVKQKGWWPKGFLPLPHPNHPEGGMLFPKAHIDEVKQQTGRDLERFDLDHDFPSHLLPEFPPAIYLTTRPDLGDVSQGRLVTLDNYEDLLGGVLNPKQLEGVRLLVSPVPQAQFNATHDRRSLRPSLGVACFDCHANGHTNAATHLLGDVRPQENRPRIDTPSLRGVNVQRLFGSKRALKTVEDFTEFEQRAAYFDGDPAAATRKGVRILERGSEVHFMSEFESILDFPPAPKLGVDGLLDPSKATEAELRGQAIFFGKGKCGTCHQAPFYTDNLMHNLQTERFYAPVTYEGHKAVGDGPIKTFPLRGLKDSPPYLHDGRLLTIEDSVEFFNLVVGAKLTRAEKSDLTAFLKAL
ncbi:MAG: cytochrome B6 [Myxococcota bacterium]